MKKKYINLFKEDGFSIDIEENSKRLKVGIPSHAIEKPFESWVEDDKAYVNELLVREINKLKAFYDYFAELYGIGLEVANWHHNDELESFDKFFESAEQTMGRESLMPMSDKKEMFSIDKDVAEAIERFMYWMDSNNLERSKGVLVAEHCGQDWTLYEDGQYAALNKISTFDLMKCLVNGYKIK